MAFMETTDDLAAFFDRCAADLPHNIHLYRTLYTKHYLIYLYDRYGSKYYTVYKWLLLYFHNRLQPTLDWLQDTTGDYMDGSEDKTISKRVNQDIKERGIKWIKKFTWPL